MKELSIEEKAKAYDKAIERAKRMFSEKELNYLFPELIEDEDKMAEKIRKDIISYLNNRQITSIAESSATEKWLDWLEKQGDANKEYWRGYREGKQEILDKYAELEKQGNKQQGKTALEAAKEEKVDNQNCVKSADKVEPKFHEGEWVVNNTTLNLCHIVKVEHGQYICDDCSFPITKENEYHLWSIEDAKDGDVLATLAGAFIYNGNNGGGSCPGSYCGINTLGRFQTGVEHHWTGKKVYPATKEQRDTLMKAMTDSGYSFDFVKKELNKIVVNPKFKIGDKIYSLRDRLECTIESIDETTYYGDTTNFDIKDQDNWKLVEPSWSEEDERAIGIIKIALEYPYDMEGKWDRKFALDWLKSLRSQKPLTNEEIEQAKKEYRDVALSKTDYIPEELTYDDGWNDAISYIKSR